MTLLAPSLQKKLLSWYKEYKRDLPWRHSQDPYAIWISEVMLQQTTSKAVIPYYKNFLKKYPHLSLLAKANKKEVFSLWAGLGYYRRAENILLAAQAIHKKKNFPQTYKELLKLPGFGPYTARSVSSLAFDEPVGVLDGNVIRFLSRFYNLPLEYWKSKNREKLQKLSNLWVQNQKSSVMNQALMELGALICTTPKALCLLCPLKEDCLGRKKRTQNQLPLKKAKKTTEFWLYQAEKISNKNKWAFIKNESSPFLKGAWMFPGQIQRIKDPLSKKQNNKASSSKTLSQQENNKVSSSKTLSQQENNKVSSSKTLSKQHNNKVSSSKALSKNQAKKTSHPELHYDFTHSIMNYKIFVQIKNKKTKSKPNHSKWFSTKDIQSLNPSSLIKKILTQQTKKTP